MFLVAVLFVAVSVKVVFLFVVVLLAVLAVVLAQSWLLL